MFEFLKRKKIKIDKGKMLQYIVIIMDGNGRWVRKRGFLCLVGYRFGVQKLKEIVFFVDEIGLKYFIVYVFLIENWKRFKEEVDNFMNFLREFFDIEIENFINKIQIRIRVIGDILKFDKDI